MTTGTCACGCGADVAPGKKFRKGHHWRALRSAAGIPESKVCAWCGRTYHRVEIGRQSNKHWMARAFCCEDCRGRATAEKLRSEMSGPNHPNWKGDMATPQAGRKRARTMYPDVQPCDVCGIAGERHHVDGNTLNNAPENIRWLCRLHHIQVEQRNSHKRKK